MGMLFLLRVESIYDKAQFYYTLLFKQNVSICFAAICIFNPGRTGMGVHFNKQVPNWRAKQSSDKFNPIFTKEAMHRFVKLILTESAILTDKQTVRHMPKKKYPQRYSFVAVLFLLLSPYLA
jgi:hypothetical protein